MAWMLATISMSVGVAGSFLRPNQAIWRWIIGLAVLLGGWGLWREIETPVHCGLGDKAACTQQLDE